LKWIHTNGKRLINVENKRRDLVANKKKNSRRAIKQKVSRAEEATQLSEPGFDPGTCGLWAHHASAAPL